MCLASRMIDVSENSNLCFPEFGKIKFVYLLIRVGMVKNTDLSKESIAFIFKFDLTEK